MSNFILLDIEYPEPPGAPPITERQQSIIDKMKYVPAHNMVVQWYGTGDLQDFGSLGMTTGEVFQFTREEWLDWFDRKKAAFEYHVTNQQHNPYSHAKSGA